ncbi:MAG: LapA family protein [Chitinivorax sp.]
MLRYLFWLFQFTLFFLLLGFTLKNSHPVAVSFFLGYQWQTPLVLALLVFFAGGAMLGVMACLAYVLKLRREILGLKKDLRSKTAALPAIDHSDAVL